MEQSPMRVLVVDDESYITDLVGTALRYEGFQVEEAPGGRAAMAAATSFRPDLVILDVMLPDLDGFEVTRRLRSEGFRAPVLFLTAKDATEDKVVGLTIGGDGLGRGTDAHPFDGVRRVEGRRHDGGGPRAGEREPARSGAGQRAELLGGRALYRDRPAPL